MREGRLESLKMSMVIASYNYDDNTGSDNADEFWNKFVMARDNYKSALKQNKLDKQENR